ncbi:S24/S26 family peptidase [Nocardioides sp. ChNu-153]|uniref:S24/S26 family peptidase n=1 Tax=unclassified Nocardioides TaxID=2615069 RepID=UPI002404C9D9|nr:MULTISPECIES: S24/S26 family peptidase [unclassified Nocardioides]MDF9715440.1 S24/S26 family peptidase [Nocardioides sp. ChNu-99]MDN7120603.1 S24/S26 family peptidase [Nocardioides sp. ChNu-153]
MGDEAERGPRAAVTSGPARPLLPWGVARVRGDSMRPHLRPGDRLLVRYGARPRPGDVVLARFPDGTLVVKRAAERRADRAGVPGWWLLSDDPGRGVDSRHRGVVPDRDVVGVVRLRWWPPRRATRPAP